MMCSVKIAIKNIAPYFPSQSSVQLLRVFNKLSFFITVLQGVPSDVTYMCTPFSQKIKNMYRQNLIFA